MSSARMTRKFGLAGGKAWRNGAAAAPAATRRNSLRLGIVPLEGPFIVIAAINVTWESTTVLAARALEVRPGQATTHRLPMSELIQNPMLENINLKKKLSR